MTIEIVDIYLFKMVIFWFVMWKFTRGYDILIDNF
jgi:hypothetical protein